MSVKWTLPGDLTRWRQFRPGHPSAYSMKRVLKRHVGHLCELGGASGFCGAGTGSTRIMCEPIWMPIRQYDHSSLWARRALLRVHVAAYPWVGYHDSIA